MGPAKQTSDGLNFHLFFSANPQQIQGSNGIQWDGRQAAAVLVQVQIQIQELNLRDTRLGYIDETRPESLKEVFFQNKWNLLKLLHVLFFN